MRRFEAKNIKSGADTRPFGDRNSKSLPKPVLMAGSSDLP
jgi:hypothetical protein